MSIMDILLFIGTVVVWHELAHFIVADRYESVNHICFIRSKTRLGKWLVWGVAVSVDDDEMTDKQLWASILAPLLWIVPAAVFGAIYLAYPHSLLFYQAAVWAVAALAVLASDIPQYFLKGLDGEEYDQYILWSAEGRYD